MTLRNLFIVNAVVALVFGIAFVLVPVPLMSLYGVTLSPAGIIVGRLFGAALIGFGALTWLAKDAAESEARGAIVLALFIGDVIGFVVALLGQLSGVINPLGWSTVVIYLLLALGFGYFQFMRPAAP